MKTSIYAVVVMSSIAAAPARACQVEVNERSTAHASLKNGGATIVNENGVGTVLVICGEFTGQVTGISRVEQLQPGMCSLLSSPGHLSLIECER